MAIRAPDGANKYKSHFNHLRQEVSLFDVLSEKGEAVKVK